MAEFTFDGKKMRNRSGQKMGELDRDLVRAWNASRLGEIQGNNIRDVNGKKVLEFGGKVVKDDRGRKVATIEEIQKVVEGEGDIALVAMWHFFARK